MNKKDLLVYSAIAIVLMIFAYFVINSFAYFDASSMCYTSISKDILKGNKKTIIRAIKNIKRRDKGEYQTFCKYVNRVSERYCIASDWHLDKNWKKNADGKNCYIKGSKTVYLYPRKDSDAGTVKERADALTELSKLSRDFWINK